MSRTTTNYAQAFNLLVSRTADEAHRRMMRNPSPLYLYFIPHGMRCGTIDDSEPLPVGAELVWSERLPGNLTRDQLAMRFHDALARLPLLPLER